MDEEVEAAKNNGVEEEKEEDEEVFQESCSVFEVHRKIDFRHKSLEVSFETHPIM